MSLVWRCSGRNLLLATFKTALLNYGLNVRHVVDYMDTFIWKVTIENYEVGERPAYVGSAVIVPRQR